MNKGLFLDSGGGPRRSAESRGTMNGGRGFLHSFGVWTVPVYLLRIMMALVRGEMPYGQFVQEDTLIGVRTVAAIWLFTQKLE
jgi:hypothetical protein